MIAPNDISSPSCARFLQCLAFMHRDVLGLVALDFTLWIIRARMMSVTLVIDVFCMHLDDLAADMAGLRVSGHVIAYFEFCGHDELPSVISACTFDETAKRHLVIIGLSNPRR